MVDEDVSKMYDMIIEYVASKQSYYKDASSPDVELSDNNEFDLTSIVNIIQKQIMLRPSMGEAASIKSYRDVRAIQAEYDMRLMDRKDYWSDASVEEQDNLDKWIYNKKLNILHMNNKDMGA